MTVSDVSDTSARSTSSEALGEKVFESNLGTLDVFAIYVGDRLGCYLQLADYGPLSHQAGSARLSGRDAARLTW